MPPESFLASIAVNSAAWLVAGVVVGRRYARRDWRELPAPGLFTRLRRWDRRGLYEGVLCVRLWKDRLPEAGTWFGGISKRRLPGVSEGGRRRLVAESLRAERVHLVLLLVVPLSAIWSRGAWFGVNVGFGLVVNLPCIVVARYNRLRLAHLT